MGISVVLVVDDDDPTVMVLRSVFVEVNWITAVVVTSLEELELDVRVEEGKLSIVAVLLVE